MGWLGGGVEVYWDKREFCTPYPCSLGLKDPQDSKDLKEGSEGGDRNMGAGELR